MFEWLSGHVVRHPRLARAVLALLLGRAVTPSWGVEGQAVLVNTVVLFEGSVSKGLRT